MSFTLVGNTSRARFCCQPILVQKHKNFLRIAFLGDFMVTSAQNRHEMAYLPDRILCNSIIAGRYWCSDRPVSITSVFATLHLLLQRLKLLT